jgi:hypothetical protein
MRCPSLPTLNLYICACLLSLSSLSLSFSSRLSVSSQSFINIRDPSSPSPSLFRLSRKWIPNSDSDSDSYRHFPWSRSAFYALVDILALCVLCGIGIIYLSCLPLFRASWFHSVAEKCIFMFRAKHAEGEVEYREDVGTDAGSVDSLRRDFSSALEFSRLNLIPWRLSWVRKIHPTLGGRYRPRAISSALSLRSTFGLGKPYERGVTMSMDSIHICCTHGFMSNTPPTRNRY